MKLIDFIDCFEAIGAPLVTIWHKDDENKPAFEGNMMDTPYWILSSELDGDSNMGAVISSIGQNKCGHDEAKLTIYVKG